MSLLREIKELIRYARTPVAEKQIVFYTEHAGYFPYFEGLVKELTRAHGQTICYITSDPNDPCLTGSTPGVNTFFLKTLLPYYMGLVKCKVFAMTLTELDQYHLKRSANPVHYVYVFHAMVSAHMMYTKGAFDHYDSVLCTTACQLDELRKLEALRNLNKKELVEAGYYRLERIHENYKEFVAENPPGPKTTILVAPSWGKNNIIESCGEALVRTLLGHDYAVIVRPHPEAVRRTPGVIDALGKAFEGQEDFTLERSVATDESLLKADLLISDCSGVILEYAFGTERPVLCIDLPLKIKNEDYEALDMEPIELILRREFGVLVDRKDIGDITGVVEDLLSRREAYRKKIIALRDKHIFNFGTSSKVGAEHIMSKLKPS